MNITPAQIRAIHQKASTLTERHGNELINGEILNILSLHQLLTWDQCVSGPSSAQLIQRLSLFRHVQQHIIEAQKKHEDALERQEGWITEFTAILKNYNPDILHSPPIEFPSSRPEAFESLLIPFIWHAYQSLALHAKASGELISADLLRVHCRALLAELSRLSSSCFFYAFNAFRQQHDTGEKLKTSTSLYRRFENSMFSGEIVGFFSEYSALARLLVIKTMHWIRSTKLLIDRLQNDLAEIAGTFFNGRLPTRIKQLKCGFSAPHSNDGMVFELMFTNRRKLIYKPRCGDTDIALNKILSWFNIAGDLEPMRTVEVLNRDKYCWHEYIGQRACRYKGEVEHYYIRIGQLAALLHILGSTDYHFENLRARGEHPYLTDNETLLSPYLKIGENHRLSGDDLIDKQNIHGLARSLFLFDARKLFHPEAASITGVFDFTERYEIIRYRNLHTDAMCPVKTYRTRTGRNIPKLGGRHVNPKQYLSCIKTGFAAMLRHIITHRDAFHSEVNSVTSFFTMEVRMIIRPTSFYVQILRDSQRPEYLRDGVERSLLFEKSARLYLPSNSPKECGRLLYEEIAMLQEYLVPWFHVRINQAGWTSTEEGHSVIVKTAQQVFEENLHQVDAQYMDLHLSTIDRYLSLS